MWEWSAPSELLLDAGSDGASPSRKTSPLPRRQDERGGEVITIL